MKKREVKSLKYNRCAKCGKMLNVASIYLPDLGEICLQCYSEFALNEDKKAIQQQKPVSIAGK